MTDTRTENTGQVRNELNIAQALFSFEPPGGLLLTTETQRGLVILLERAKKALLDIADELE